MRLPSKSPRCVAALRLFGAVALLAGMALLVTSRARPASAERSSLARRRLAAKNLEGVARRAAAAVGEEPSEAESGHEEGPEAEGRSWWRRANEGGELEVVPVEAGGGEEAEESDGELEGAEEDAEGGAGGDEAGGESVLEGEEAEGAVEGEEGEEVEEEEEEEEELEEIQEEGVEKVNLAIALMLLGTVSFIMTLFMMVNNEDEDMRLYVWQVISSTISIFMAVLFFSSVNLVVHSLIDIATGIDKEGQQGRVIHAVGDCAQLLFYFVLMQVLVAFQSSALKADAIDPDLTKKRKVAGEYKDMKVSVDEQKQQIERRMRVSGILLAHTSGFAAINVGGMFQHSREVVENHYMVFLVVPFMFFGLIALCRGARRVRRKVQEQVAGWHRGTYQVLGAETTPRDPREMNAADSSAAFSPSEVHAELMERWDDCVYEAETDVCALCTSFLLVQACRYVISGVLPDYLGNEEEFVLHEQMCSIKLAGLGLSFAGLVMVIVVCTGGAQDAPEPGSFRAFLKRCTVVAQNGSAMAFAWCMLVVCRWEIARIKALGDPNGIICRVAIALSVSFAGFFIIAGLDALADLSITGPAVDNALVSLIQGLSILVGFSWEQAFDGGVECIAEMSDNPVGIELVLGICVALLVLQPWRRYILKKVIALQDENKIRNSMEEKDPRVVLLQEKFKDSSDSDLVFESMRRGLY